MSGADRKFFNSTKKGENHELREELSSSYYVKKRDAVKKVIAYMTVGKDVSSLFSDVINCLQTDKLELKKLVYLYLVNYSKSNPELALMAVNTFVKDCNDPNPLVRALAIRTMGCIRVDKITEYLCEPLGLCLKDEDPYVKKTAAICVAKLYSISPEIVEERGFVSDLQNLTSDANPTVVANAVAALSEIGQENGTTVLKLNSLVVQKLLAALNECTEWGQVFILDSLSEYECRTTAEAGAIIERVLPRLSHGNSAVVMSAFKVILHFIENVEDEEKLRGYQKKLAPPLITLLNASPEIQYVVLRNINLIVLKHPKILEHEVKVFFCKYNDPIYVKMEKLEILIRLVTDKNIDQILLELKEYSTEVDVDFVRRSVRCIGKCAIKLENSAERCIQVLLNLIETKVNYVVQEAIVVIKDIFRKYPNRYEGIIGKLCENLECLDEPEAKASMIWIIGEYADQIEGADDLLESFMDSFHEETAQVQLQLLTGTVKLFLKQPENAQELVQKVLNMATQESDNPDLRDRGYVYWRLLSSDPEAARAVVMSEKPSLSDDSFNLEPALLDDLISQIGSLASIYHKPAEQFVIRANQQSSEDDKENDEEEEEEEEQQQQEPSPYYAAPVASKPVVMSKPVALSSASNDLLDLMDDLPPPPSIPVPLSSKSIVVKIPLVTDTEKSQGITMSGAMARGSNNNITLECDVCNSGSTPVQQLAIQFNKNAFGVAPAQPNINLPSAISNGSTVSITISLTVTPQMLDAANVSGKIQAAMKNMATGGVFYLIIPIAIDTLFAVGFNMEPNALVAAWKGIPDNLDVSAMVNDINTDQEVIKSKLSSKNVSFVAKRDLPDKQSSLYFACRTVTNASFLIEMKFKDGLNICKITVKSQRQDMSELCKNFVIKTISA